MYYCVLLWESEGDLPGEWRRERAVINKFLLRDSTEKDSNKSM